MQARPANVVVLADFRARRQMPPHLVHGGRRKAARVEFARRRFVPPQFRGEVLQQADGNEAAGRVVRASVLERFLFVRLAVFHFGYFLDEVRGLFGGFADAAALAQVDGRFGFGLIGFVGMHLGHVDFEAHFEVAAAAFLALDFRGFDFVVRFLADEAVRDEPDGGFFFRAALFALEELLLADDREEDFHVVVFVVELLRK